MSAIDIVLVVIALVAVGVAVACALQLKGLRAELRERGDSGAEMLAALEQAKGGRVLVDGQDVSRMERWNSSASCGT